MLQSCLIGRGGGVLLLLGDIDVMGIYAFDIVVTSFSGLVLREEDSFPREAERHKRARVGD